MGQYILAYTSRLTGQCAEMKLAIMDDNQAAISSLNSLSEVNYQELLDVIAKYNEAIEKINTIEACTITQGSNVLHYHSFGDAWVDATTNYTGNVELKLCIDQEIPSGASFMDSCVRRQGSTDQFKNGSLYLKKDKLNLTLNLNKHKLSKADCDYSIYVEDTNFKVCNGTIDTVSTTAKDKDDEYDFSFSNVEFAGNNVKKHAINADNVSIHAAHEEGEKSKVYSYVESAIMSNNVVVIDSTEFANNSSKNNDGGAVVVKNSTGFVYFIKCTFIYNYSQEKGGAIYVEGENSVQLTECTFTSNSASLGGALFIQKSNVDINKCKFYGNSSQNDGGALKFDSVYPMYPGKNYFILDENTFENNTANGKGGAVYFDNNAKVTTFRNNTITNNTCGDIGGGMYLKGSDETSNPIILEGTNTVEKNTNTNGKNSNVYLNDAEFYCASIEPGSNIGISAKVHTLSNDYLITNGGVDQQQSFPFFPDIPMEYKVDIVDQVLGSKEYVLIKEDSYIIGDVDLDYEVSIYDATLIQKGLAKLTELTPEQLRGGCVDGDELNISDATYIQRYLANLGNPYLIGWRVSPKNEE